MFGKLNNKAFTLIELIVVIAIIGILVLLATPKFLSHTKDARMSQIQNDVRTYEMIIESELVKDQDLMEGWELADSGELSQYATDGLLYDKKGKIDQIEGDYYLVPNTMKVNSNLSGNFLVNSVGGVLYYENDTERYLANDEDFEWVSSNTSHDYTAPGQVGKGHYRYTGNKEIVEIPHEINGHPMTNYASMFKESDENIKKVISTNPNVTIMYSMFYSSKATELDLSSFDTSKVTSMRSMFKDSHATSLDLSNFNTSKVTSMNSMFYNSNATTLDLSSFNTSNVTDMSSMFYSSKAASLDLSSFNTSKVTSMSSMFGNSQATTLDLSNFNTSNVTSMGYMFGNSQAITLDLSSLDTSNVTDMNRMFADSQATTLDLSNFNTSNVTNMSSMFNGSHATTLDLSNFNTSNVTDMSSMFERSQATSLNLSSFDTGNVTDMNMSYMFYNSKITEGYARTQEDANRFNSSRDKPSGLKFVVK